MVGMGLIMLAVSWFGTWLHFRGRLETTCWYHWPRSRLFPPASSLCWRAGKSEGELRDWAWRRIPWLAGAVLVVLGIAVVAAFIERASVTGKPVPWPPVGAGLSRHRAIGHIRSLRRRAPAARRLAVRPDRGVLRSGASLACGDALALYDPLYRHCRRRRRPGKVALLPVLRRRGGHIAGHRDLHGPRLLAVPRQAAQRIQIGVRPVAGRRCVIVARRLLEEEWIHDGD
jgi:hypothetical protein